MVNKTVALSIVVLISVYIAYRIKKYGEDKVAFHLAVIEFITYAKRQISHFCTPTPKIFENYSDPLLDKNCFFEKKGIENNIYLDNRGKKILTDFFAILGKSDTGDQIANCDYAIEAINDLIKQYKDDADKRYKAYAALSVLIGLMLVIMMI